MSRPGTTTVYLVDGSHMEAAERKPAGQRVSILDGVAQFSNAEGHVLTVPLTSIKYVITIPRA